MWTKTIGFHNYILDVKTIILGEVKNKYKLLNLKSVAAKLVIYSNRNKIDRLILDQVNFVETNIINVYGIHYIIKSPIDKMIS